MTRRITYALLAMLVLALVAAQGASAASASSDAILKDSSDGVIDGDYTLAQMREADRDVPASAREYYGWEDAYNDYLRRLADPDAPAIAAPVDSNKNGTIDASEKATAVKKTKSEAKKSKAKKKNTKKAVVVKKSTDDCKNDDDEDCEVVAAADDDGSDDDSGGSWLIWLIVGLPVLIVAIGAWRMARRGTKGASSGVSEPDGFPEPGSTPGPGRP
jgi:hypothetical protein